MDCVFCRLLREDTGRWVAREADVCAFTPLNPLAPGHTLVVPTRHYAGVLDTPPEVLAASMSLVQRLAAAMRAALAAPGVNVLSASGPGSEQSVPHLHFHVVPRWVDDVDLHVADGHIPSPAGRRPGRDAGRRAPPPRPDPDVSRSAFGDEAGTCPLRPGAAPSRPAPLPGAATPARTGRRHVERRRPGRPYRRSTARAVPRSVLA
ncbi:HIT domain-containing protein [Streptomyces sp. KL110A]|uniref:HIT domain-containing protein n=1 Tax=Streptomyces sp. KL110A TaxID=3384221 RepID=UPI0038CA91F8